MPKHPRFRKEVRRVMRDIQKYGTDHGDEPLNSRFQRRTTSRAYERLGKHNPSGSGNFKSPQNRDEGGRPGRPDKNFKYNRAAASPNPITGKNTMGVGNKMGGTRNRPKKNKTREDAVKQNWKGRPAKKDLYFARKGLKKYGRMKDSDYGEFTSSKAEEKYWRRAEKIGGRQIKRRRAKVKEREAGRKNGRPGPPDKNFRYSDKESKYYHEYARTQYPKHLKRVEREAGRKRKNGGHPSRPSKKGPTMNHPVLGKVHTNRVYKPVKKSQYHSRAGINRAASRRLKKFNRGRTVKAV